MSIFQLFRNIQPFVRPYRLLVALTLILTLVGSVMQQVNATEPKVVVGGKHRFKVKTTL
ncbi:MAG: hypothetical protein IKN93_00945 [Bacteroidales bacterium]|nr:hypothetical protein [Bacteroidales bacterium]